MATDEQKPARKQQAATQSGMGAAYVLAMIGAAVYWVQQASGFWNVVGALLKALVWPSFVVYDLLRFIG